MKSGRARSGASSQPPQCSTGNWTSSNRNKKDKGGNSARGTVEVAKTSAADEAVAAAAAEGRMMAPDDPETPEDESPEAAANAPPAAAAQARKSTNEVSQLHRKIAELEAQLASNAKESKVTVDL